jgi:nucleotide-binding universal stress UspA family protein
VVHVVDDDQPRRLIDAERHAAASLLNEYASSIRDVEGVVCNLKVASGDPSQALVDVAADVRANLMVIGAHRRRLPQDIFVGTTAERTIRSSRVPVLMAHTIPAREYQHALIGVDFSSNSAQALRAANGLKFGDKWETTILHVFDAPDVALMMRPSVPQDRLIAYLEDQQKLASEQLNRFLAEQGSVPTRSLLKPNQSSTATIVTDVAAEISADLIVLGTHGRTGISGFLLGNVAEEVLRISSTDVLTVPPAQVDAVRKG